MRLKLQRIQGYRDYTIGYFFIDNFLMSFTLEDERREIKIKGETRIPAGKYKMKLNTTAGMNVTYKKLFSFHLGMLQICDIPDFDLVFIHIGNNDINTAGCPLVGMSHEIGKNFIGSSTVAYKMIYPKIAAELQKGNEVFMEIVDCVS